MSCSFSSYKNIIYLLGYVFFLGCSSSSSTKVEETSLMSEVFLEDSLLHAPYGLCATDTYLAIANPKSDTILDLFDYNGKLVKRMIPRGQGVNEGLFISQIQYDRQGNRLYLPDLHKKNLLILHDVTAENPTIRELKLGGVDAEAYKDSVYLNSRWGRLSDGTILATNGSPAGMFAAFSSEGKFLRFYEPFPDKHLVSDQLNDWANSLMYTPLGSFSPEADKAVFVYAEADIMTIFKVDGKDRLKVKSVRKSYPDHMFVLQHTPTVVQAAITDDTHYYSQGVAASDKYIYVLWLDTIYKEVSENHDQTVCIKVFDWDGNLLENITLDTPVKNITVTPDDKVIYALSENGESGYQILKFKRNR